MLISVILASRGRPAMAKKRIQQMIDFASGKHPIEIIVSVDTTEPYLEEYKKLSEFSMVTLIINDNDCCVKATNEGAKLAAGELIINLSDDSQYFQNYDDVFVELLKNNPRYNMDCIIAVSDGRVPELQTQQICTKKYYDRFGYFFNPGYKSLFADCEYTEVAFKLNRVIDVRNTVVVEHQHYLTGKVPYDETYAHENQPAFADVGRNFIHNRRIRNFDIKPEWIIR